MHRSMVYSVDISLNGLFQSERFKPADTLNLPFVPEEAP